MGLSKKEKYEEYHRKYREQHREKARQYQQLLRNRNKALGIKPKPVGSKAEYRRNWIKNNPEKYLASIRNPVNMAKRREETRRRRALVGYVPLVKGTREHIVWSLRDRIRKAVKHGYKSDTTQNLLGCSIDEFKAHIQKQFKPGMAWNNHGLKGWHIDHIRPCSSFNLLDPEQQKQCFHYTNMQPLWWNENLAKAAKYEPESSVIGTLHYHF